MNNNILTKIVVTFICTFGLIFADDMAKSYHDYMVAQRNQGAMQSDILSEADYMKAQAEPVYIDEMELSLREKAEKEELQLREQTEIRPEKEELQVRELTLEEFNAMIAKGDPDHEDGAQNRDCDWNDCYYDTCCYYTAYYLYNYGQYNTCGTMEYNGYDCSDNNTLECNEWVTTQWYSTDFTECADPATSVCGDGTCASDEDCTCADCDSEFECAFPNCNSDGSLINSWIFDGYCDGGDYNTADCNWENGNCCESTCSDSNCSLSDGDCQDPAACENIPW